MNRITRFAALAAVLGAACGAALAQDKPMTADEIRQTWVGKKLFIRASNGVLSDFWMRADGTMEMSVNNFSDSGTYRLTDNGYCGKWKKIRSGEERCFTVVRRGNTMYVLNPDQSVGSEVIRITDQ